jgi:hypothetical protein
MSSFAGVPTTVQLSDISWITVDPAPTTTFWPMLMSWKIWLPMPTQHLAPIETLPAKFTLGEIWKFLKSRSILTRLLAT